MNQPPSLPTRKSGWARQSVMLKLLIIGVLMLLLLVPAFLVNQLIHERQGLRNEATREVSSKWGDSQTIAGPVISVPYKSVAKDDDGKTVITDKGYAHFLPDAINISGNVSPEQRRRGIYVVVLYNTKLDITGNFSALNTDALTIPEEDFQWENALFTIGISDMKGVQSAINLQFNASNYVFGPGTLTKDILASGASVPIDLSNGTKDLNFAYSLDLNGSTDLYFTPFGKKTTVNLTSTWADPKFEGASLPDKHEVSQEGFTANWTELHLNRNYPQQGKNKFIGRLDTYNLRQMTNAFGVRLLLPIDEYKKTDRSTKYATFFVFITFLTFFFIEVLNKKRLHPIQYLLVGAAIILFYILLLSIAEHLTFNWAYWISCAIILALITTYCWFILKNKKLTFLVFGILAILYGFFYSLLQLQDYALLMGSFGLLLILATIMYLTRSVDWYKLGKEEEA